MEKQLMQYKHRWIILFFLILGGGVGYLTIPLVHSSFYSFYKFGLWLTNIISALSPLLWWQLGVIFLTCSTLAILKNLKKSISSGTGRKDALKDDPDKPGRLWEIWQLLRRAEAGQYYQGEIKNILQSVIINSIALKKEISTEEARANFRQGIWTEEKLLKVFFTEPILMKEKRRLWWRFKKNQSYFFLTEVEKVLDKLTSANILFAERENANHDG